MGRDLGMRFAMIRGWVMMKLRRKLNLGARELASRRSQLVGCNAPGSAPRAKGNSVRARDTRQVHVKDILVDSPLKYPSLANEKRRLLEGGPGNGETEQATTPLTPSGPMRRIKALVGRSCNNLRQEYKCSAERN